MVTMAMKLWQMSVRTRQSSLRNFITFLGSGMKILLTGILVVGAWFMMTI